MPLSIETTWLKPPQQIGGLDHLGVQAPCIQIYAQLLPGITNVTDRARYYSFYPWLLSRFEKEKWRSEADISRMLRRAECLLTMIALHHESSVNDGLTVHRAAMVGSDALSYAIKEIDSGQSVQLSDYSSLGSSKHRYFANPLGGLGQYYFGALSGLGLLGGDKARHMRLPKGTGTVLADIVEKYVPGDLFIQTIKSDMVDQNGLKQLSGFCSCQLSQADEEVNALVGVMLKGWEYLNPEAVATLEEQEASRTRAHTLSYLCLLADQANLSNHKFNIPIFRGLSYTQYSHQGEGITYPESLSKTAKHWQVYQRNELLSISLQGLFFCILRMAEFSNQTFQTTDELSNWFWYESIGASVIKSFNFPRQHGNDWLKGFASELAPYSNWKDKSHEIQCMHRVNQETDKQGLNENNVQAILKDSLLILSAIICRDENNMGYDTITFPEGFLSFYPVNLISVASDWSGPLSSLEPKQALTVFTRSRCLDAHLRVAMRKLSHQGKNTFRFEPSELGLVIKSIPRAANTTPRFNQAIRILNDLGLLEPINDSYQTTKRGQAFIQEAT